MREQALAYFVSMGWTPAQAAGIVANLVAESNLNPGATGDGGAAYGIAQWHPDRQANFAAVIGKDIHGSTLEEQMAFVNAELNGSEKVAGDALRGCTTARDAGAYVSTLYERPADKEGEATRRGALAESILAESSGAPVGRKQGVGAPPAARTAAPGDQPTEGNTMAPSWIDAIGPIAGALNPIAGLVVTAFSPLIKEKLTKALAKHTDSPDTAQQVSDSIIAAAQKVTGIADPVQAAATIASKSDPEQVQQVEQATSDLLDKIAPLLDKLGELDKARWDAEIASKDAASKRSIAERWDMTPWLVWFAGGTSTLLVLALTAALIYQAILSSKGIDTALVGLAGPLLAIAMGVWREIFAYRFDGSKVSEAQNAVIQSIAQK